MDFNEIDIDDSILCLGKSTSFVQTLNHHNAKSSSKHTMSEGGQEEKQNRQDAREISRDILVSIRRCFNVGNGATWEPLPHISQIGACEQLTLRGQPNFDEVVYCQVPVAPATHPGTHN